MRLTSRVVVKKEEEGNSRTGSPQSTNVVFERIIYLLLQYQIWAMIGNCTIRIAQVAQRRSMLGTTDSGLSNHVNKFERSAIRAEVQMIQ